MAIVAALAVLAVTTVAIVDNDRKDKAAAKASAAEWPCVHRGVHCDIETTAEIEHAWVRRERAYKVADVSLFALGAIATAVYVRRRR